jgi:hypothetical protein
MAAPQECYQRVSPGHSLPVTYYTPYLPHSIGVYDYKMKVIINIKPMWFAMQHFLHLLTRYRVATCAAVALSL